MENSNYLRKITILLCTKGIMISGKIYWTNRKIPVKAQFHSGDGKSSLHCKLNNLSWSSYLRILECAKIGAITEMIPNLQWLHLLNVSLLLKGYLCLSQYTRFLQNISPFKVNDGISSMHPCMVPFERALYLKVFGQVLVAPFEF